MKLLEKISNLFKSEFLRFSFIYFFVGIIIFAPLFKGKVLFSSNLLVSFFNPWAKEAVSGWENGVPNKPVGIDDLRIFYPQRNFTTDMLKQGQIPFWNPYSYSGNYHLGLSETGVFYPLSIIFFLMPQISAWQILIIIQPLIIGIGMYLYLRLIVSKNAALFGSLVLSLSGLVIVRMVDGIAVGHSLIWLPFCFFAIEAFFISFKTRYLFVLLLALSMSILAGWFQFTFYIFSFSFLYTVLRILKTGISAKKLFILIPFIFSPLVTLFHLVPALETLVNSPRSLNISSDLAKHLLPLQHLLTIVFPDFWGNPGSYNFFGRSEYKESVVYIGVLPFILSLFAFINFKKNNYVKFFSLIAILSAIFAIDSIISRAFVNLPIPIISSFLPNRVLMLATFSLSVLSAFGFDYLINNIKVKERLKPFFIIIPFFLITDLYLILVFISRRVFPSVIEDNIISGTLLSVLAGIGLVSKDFQFLVQLRNVLIPHLLLIIIFLIIVFKNRINKKLFIFIIFILFLIPQIYYIKKYLPFSEPSFVFPKNEVFTKLGENKDLNRFISVGDGHIESNLSLFYNLYSPEGVSSMYPRVYGELMTYPLVKAQVIDSFPRIETRINPDPEKILIDKNKYLLRLMQVDAVRYVLKTKKEEKNFKDSKIDASTFSLIWQNKAWQLFENKETLPKVFWTNNYSVAKDKNLNLMKIFEFNQDPKKITLEEDPKINTTTNNSKGNVSVIKYSPNKIELNSLFDQAGLVYLSDTYSPKFLANVDGKPTKILKANWAFRAIPVSSGKHNIEIYYDDTSFKLSLYISIFSLVIFVLLIYFVTKKSK